MLLPDKVALITGGGSGLGAETGRVFAEHGARVVLADVNDQRGQAVAAGIGAQGSEASFIHTNVRDTASVEEAVAYAERIYGRLDIVVANAGIMGNASHRPTDTVTDDDWAEVIDVNLSGVLRSVRAAIPALRRAGGGAVSVTASTAGVFATLNRAAYSASKGGVMALVRALAIELAPDRIRVNAMAPGLMATNIGESSPHQDQIPLEDHPRGRRQGLKTRVLRPDRDTTREAAYVHLFLCSYLAGYVNGETIVVDGGFGIWDGT